MYIEMAYVGVLLYCVSSILRPADWTDSFKGQPVDVVIFAFIALGALMAMDLDRWSSVASHPLLKIVLLHIVVTVLTAMLTLKPDLLIGQAFDYFRLFCVFIVFAIFVDTPSKVRGVFTLVIVLTTIVAYQGIGLASTGVGLAGQDLYWGGRIRWVGMYNGANVLCMLFVITMAFVMQFILGPWGWATRIFALAAGGLIVNGIYLTNSRGGFLAFACVVGLSFLLRHKEMLSRFSPKTLAAGALVIFLVLQVAPSRMESIADKEHSAAGRIDAWQEGIEMIKEHPLFGIGKGEWLNYHRRLAHNTFVQMMGETGLVGLFFWLAMLYLMFRTLVQTLKKLEDPQQQSLVTGILVATCGFLIVSWFITTTQFDWTYIFAGLTAATAVANNVRTALSWKDVRWITVIMLGGFVAVYVTVRMFYLVNG